MKAERTGTVKSRIKRGDQVVFIAGKEYNRYDSAGKRQPFRGRVIAVEGAMLVKRHRKPVPQMNQQGGIIEREAWVDVSNVAVIDPETGKPTRIRIEERDGKRVRVAKSGKVIPEPNVFGKKEVKKDKEEESE